MNIQNIIVYLLVAAAVVFLALKFLKPVFRKNKKGDPEKNEAGCDNNCNCK